MKKVVQQVNPADAAIQRKRAAMRKIKKDIDALWGNMEERTAALSASMKELHLKETENLADGPEYFQKRYDQEKELLEHHRREMETYKIRFKLAQAERKKAIERICNLRQEIEEAKSPIIKLSKTLSDEGWKDGETDLLKDYGLAESIIDILKEEGYTTIGKIMDETESSWRDISGIGEATQEKVTQAVAEMIDVYHKHVNDLRELAEKK